MLHAMCVRSCSMRKHVQRNIYQCQQRGITQRVASPAPAPAPTWLIADCHLLKRHPPSPPFGLAKGHYSVIGCFYFAHASSVVWHAYCFANPLTRFACHFHAGVRMRVCLCACNK